MVQDLLAHKVLKVQQVHKDLQVVLVLVLLWKDKLLKQAIFLLQATLKVTLI